MLSYLISYDLRKPGQDYDELFKAIKAISQNNWCHCLESVWVIKHNGTSTTIRDALAKHMDANDSLFVVQLTRDAAWQGLSDVRSKWMKENL